MNKVRNSPSLELCLHLNQLLQQIESIEKLLKQIKTPPLTRYFWAAFVKLLVDMVREWARIVP